MGYKNFEDQIKYVFKKPYSVEAGTIPEGTEIIYWHGDVFVNGGMCDAYSRTLLLNLINNPEKSKEYLKKMYLKKEEEAE